jgi:SanA protein
MKLAKLWSTVKHIVKNHKGIITVSTLVITFLSLPFVSSIWIQGVTSDEIYDEVLQAPQKEVALVLGAARRGNEPSDILRDRLDVGIALYKNKKVEKIIMSGTGDEVLVMLNYAKKQGVPDADILRDADGFNTLASIQHIPLEVNGVTIVTQRYHLYRALFYAQHYGRDAVGVTSDLRTYAKIKQFKKREVIARSKAMLDVLIGDGWNERVREF